MRDVVWTIIIIWLVYKLVDIFKGSTSKKAENRSSTQHTSAKPQSFPDKDAKKAIRNLLNKEGEYVDFEEVK